ncbi:hypothetical protein [Flavobacterium sp.]|uniref:hypothetical protein n=1 Tax=Flavobacterium sp. TaxID=239 RepID=UPI002B4AFF0F|nr:hypothetical protein [Flavobacterium sp.]HLP63698.1 hypothetical protein [Flavobacterium sp.]
MIQSIYIIVANERKSIDFDLSNQSKVIVNVATDSSSFDVEITFEKPIKKFRNHDYKWVDVNQNRIANWFCPKIIQLENGTFVQANVNNGIWEIDAKQKNVLLWRFNPEFAHPITQYSGEINTKKIISAQTKQHFTESLALLFSKLNAVELSRSAIPFSAIACFTDHCDYDTAENLKIQREFFNKINLKTTKGFFTHHFSKREDNASFENETAELQLWENDQHEMCYHSLTQSIREKSEAMAEFRQFQPPFPNAKVWIDHGFQPYNFTLFENNMISKSEYESVISSKGIEVLWNYIDAGNATIGTINQLDSTQFTLNNYYRSIQNQPFIKRMVLLVKNIIFHYDNDEFRVRNYIDALAFAKAVVKKKQISAVFGFIKNIFPVLLMLLKVLFQWNSAKNKTFKMAKYSPIFFKHQISEKELYVFQTIEMVDFKRALCKENIDLLVEQSGLFIAHTYFSVNMNHYSGKLINSDKTLNAEVVTNFNYLSEKINQKSIWNPTLSQLLHHFEHFQNAVFDVDENGAIYCKNTSEIAFRSLT